MIFSKILTIEWIKINFKQWKAFCMDKTHDISILKNSKYR